MNILKIIFGLILFSIIPAHWFLGGIVLSNLGPWGVVVAILWIALLIFSIKLIINGITENSSH